ncbi:hypothetical protein ROS62_14805 [Streptomyces sp. DSM 41972]|uniref:Uncharacterized protein n=1 Tax=Streptomyces althioticus subsp. attaecolombicae TaxID=3075534 RepID=A0ABU3HZG7_9ACTN|nr:hypothetical protein [Streptomyces sp. DSM 41972]
MELTARGRVARLPASPRTVVTIAGADVPGLAVRPARGLRHGTRTGPTPRIQDAAHRHRNDPNLRPKEAAWLRQFVSHSGTG